MFSIKFHIQVLVKNKEYKTWHVRIFPKIKRNLDKLTEWSASCLAMVAGGGLFKVTSSEFEGGYCVDLKIRSCEYNRWNLTQIPCHHAIAYYKTHMIPRKAFA